MQRRQLVQLAGAALAAPVLTAHAQSFPARPIKLIIAFPAGGPTDITMRSLADGASNRAIAQAMALSENTVKYHIKNIYGKLGVRSRIEAIRTATNLGFGNRN